MFTDYVDEIKEEIEKLKRISEGLDEDDNGNKKDDIDFKIFNAEMSLEKLISLSDKYDRVLIDSQIDLNYDYTKLLKEIENELIELYNEIRSALL